MPYALCPVVPHLSEKRYSNAISFGERLVFYEPQRAQRKRGERKDLRIIANTYLALMGESDKLYYFLGFVKL